MSKLLVLVRHGKAQSRDLGLVDFERELTGRGKRSLKAWLPKSGGLLAQEEASTYQLWASPAARTMQTADLVAKEWGKCVKGFPKEPTPVDALWEGDMQGLMKAFHDSPADVVVVCGHNPYIEMLCSELTGSDITFATGGVAAVRVDGATCIPQARLLWFVQGPESRNWKR